MTPPLRATIADLDAAKAELERWNESWTNDRSNNLNKHHIQREICLERVRVPTRQLKIQGDLAVETAVGGEIARGHLPAPLPPHLPAHVLGLGASA